MTRIGITGHRYFAAGTLPLVEEAVATVLATVDGPIEAITSLAVGADQVLARQALQRGGSVTFVQPCRQAVSSFRDDERAEFERLRELATVVALPFDEPSNDAYEAAGVVVVALSELLIAVWDGLPAVGKGGTGDAVAAARALGREVEILWPEGAARA